MRWFSDLVRRSARRSHPATRRPGAARARLELEALEDRLVPATAFVVPTDVPVDNLTTFRTLHDALQAFGRKAGDVIQLEPGASPGVLTIGNIPGLPNLTIQGDPAVGSADVGTLTIENATTIDSTRAGLTFKNLHLDLARAGGTMTFQANGTIEECWVTSEVDGSAIHLDGTTAAVLRNNRIEQFQGGTSDQGVIEVTTRAGASNLIQGNSITNLGSNVLTPALAYTGANTITDRVLDNTLAGNNSNVVFVNGGVSGLTLQGNTITSAGSIGILVAAGAQNLSILGNSVTTSFGASGTAAVAVSTDIGVTTSVVVAGNSLNGAGGAGLLFAGGLAVNARVEGNELTGTMGVRIASDPTGIDLGGGSQSSRGGNNFRSFTAAATSTSGAIVMQTSSAAVLPAQDNLFAVADPETVIFDKTDDSTRADVDPTAALTGNAAYVQSLFVRFLHRAGNLADPNDAGFWVSALNNGSTAAAVAHGVVRSLEASDLVVADLFRTILHRAAAPAERFGFADQLRKGATLESIEGQFLASDEFRVQRGHGSDTGFVISLYETLLERVPTADEVAPEVNGAATAGRAVVANNFLISAEFRTCEVRQLYLDLLNRTPSDAEVSGWAGTNFDLLTISEKFAASAEFQAVG